MNFWPVEHFFEHISHHFWVGLLLHLLHPSKSDDKYAQKSVQLVRGSSFWSDFLQNPYFSQFFLTVGQKSFGNKIPFLFLDLLHENGLVENQIVAVTLLLADMDTFQDVNKAKLDQSIFEVAFNFFYT